MSIRDSLSFPEIAKRMLYALYLFNVGGDGPRAEARSRLWALKENNYPESYDNDDYGEWLKTALHQEEEGFVADSLEHYDRFSEDGNKIRSHLGYGIELDTVDQIGQSPIGEGRTSQVFKCNVSDNDYAFKFFKYKEKRGKQQNLINLMDTLDHLFRVRDLNNVPKVQASSLDDNCLVTNFIPGRRLDSDSMSLAAIVDNEDHFKAFLQLLTDSFERGMEPDWCFLENFKYNEDGFFIIDYYHKIDIPDDEIERTKLYLRAFNDAAETIFKKKNDNLSNFWYSRFGDGREQYRRKAEIEYLAAIKMLDMIVDHINSTCPEGLNQYGEEIFENYRLSDYKRLVNESTRKPELEQASDALKRKAPYLFNDSGCSY